MTLHVFVPVSRAEPGALIDAHESPSRLTEIRRGEKGKEYVQA